MSLDKGIDVSRAVLEELVWMARFALWQWSENKDTGKNERRRTKYYDSNIDGTQDAEFVCFFEKASFALSEWQRGGSRQAVEV